MIAALPLISSALSAVKPADSLASAASTVANTAQTGTDFASMLGQISADGVKSLKSAESLAVDGLQGQGNIQQVVGAVMSAQENLQTALAVRDKSVAAFQEVTRMSI